MNNHIRRLLTAIFILFGMTVVNAQNLVKNELDSLSVYAELFEKMAEDGNIKDAICYGLNYKDICDRHDTKNNSLYCNNVFILSELYESEGSVDKSFSLLTEILPIVKDVFGENSKEYALALENLAYYNSIFSNFQEAIQLGSKVIDIRKVVLGTNHPDYATSLDNLASYYSKIGNYSDAIRLCTEAMEITKKSYGSNHPDYALALNNLAGYYSDLSNYHEAIRLETESLKIIKKYGSDDTDLATIIANLASMYSSIGNDSDAIRLGTEAMEIRKKTNGTNHIDYALSLSNLALYYSNLGNYHESIRLSFEALGITKGILGTKNRVYATFLDNLSTFYALLGNYKESIRLCTEAKEIRKNVLGNNNLDYATSLNNISAYYADLGNYTEAIVLCTEAADTRKMILGVNHPVYATSLNNLATYYSKLGNYHEAIRLGTEAKEIQKMALGKDHIDYAISVSNLSAYYSRLGNYHEAIRLGKESMEIKTKVFGMHHPNYVNSIINLSSIYSCLRDFSEAIHLGTEAMGITMKVLGDKHPTYAVTLNNLAHFNSSIGNYSEAIRIGTEAMKIRKEVFGIEHPDYATSLDNLAIDNLSIGNYSEAWNYFKQSVDIKQAYILRSFSGLSSGLRETLWNNDYSYKFNCIFPSFVYRYQTNETVSELYDKTALFAKGILLNTGISMRKLILESGDPALIAKYDALTTNHSIYDKQLEKPINVRCIDIDSLRSVIQQQEMELARESKVYGDYARNLRITWKDVQQRLDKDDIAIEFLDFPVDGTDSTMYVALTLRKGYDNPHMVTLFEKKQLKGISESIYYTSDRVYNLVWKPLEVELSGVKDIYFSPSGELHRIGIEYVPMTRTENISDKYALHRLSSTRQLAFIQDETKGEKSVLYGGLEYEGKKGNNSSGVSAAEKTAEDRGLADLNHVNVDSLGLRGSYEYLPGTKEEGDQIASNLKKHSIPYLYYSGKTGTEESFKHLDGTKPKIMHIATHGFYLTERDAVRTEFFRPIQQEDRRAYYEDKPMTRSGLLLSGCNPALNHEMIPEGVEDGILTAQEISKLDLRGLDLVVLSACQTGLGDITSGEGVFGLQRGFKQAGAKTIIMSLWKVSDSATRNLMTSFYGHYLSGMSKERAFHMAQDELRKQSSSNQRRPDWAAFVMLDGNI